VVRWEIVEEPALAEEDGPELDFIGIENALLQTFLRGVRAVQHDVTVTGCFFWLAARMT
jgi:hypothetical protein